MSSPRITIIVPVHNGERYIAQTLASIFAQTRPADEVLIIDDASTDGTAGVVAGFGKRVRYEQRDKAGVSAARNYGISIATGDLIAFLDADDLIEPRKLELQAACFADTPGLMFCDGKTTNFWSQEIPEAMLEGDPRFKMPEFTQDYFGHISTWLAHKRLVEQVGGFNEKLVYAEDTDWFLRVRDSGVPTHRLPDLVSRRRLHLHNVTRYRLPAHDAGIAEAIKRSLDRKRKMAAQQKEAQP